MYKIDVYLNQPEFTSEVNTEELKLSTHEVDMVLLENQLKENNLRRKSFFKNLIRKIKGLPINH